MLRKRKRQAYIYPNNLGSLLILVFVLLAQLSCGQEQNQSNAISPEKYPEFIKEELNYFEFADRKTIEELSKKWNKNSGNFIVAHFGDSHVQPDYFTGTVRKKMQEIKGNAGRGMIFPYSIAKTYSQSDYSSSFEGKWLTGNSIQIPPRLPVGVSGFAAHTIDKNAAFSISFKSPLNSGEKILKIFCDRLKNGYTITITSGDETKVINLANDESKTPYVEVSFKKLSDNITFRLSKENSNDEPFKLYGISIENKSNGVIYHNLGVGGACFSALNYQKYFEKEFPYLSADFVICDWGGNDFMYKNRVEPELEEIMIQTIKKIRNINPEAIILIPSAQDINKKGKNVTAAKQYAALARKVALENGCLFYDWYVISGGPRSMFKWSDLGIAGKDNVHLNAKGYKLKGELFMQAFLNTMKRIETNKLENNLILSNQSYYVPDTVETNLDSEKTEKKELKVQTKKRDRETGKTTKTNKQKVKRYKVKKGDTLSGIARKNGISLGKLKSLNRINGSSIRVGQVLIIGN